MYLQLNCKEILDSLTYYKQVLQLGNLHGDLHSHLHGHLYGHDCLLARAVTNNYQNTAQLKKRRSKATSPPSGEG